MLAKTRQTWKLDGMNTLEYKTISREYLPLYTNITVDIGTEEGLSAAAAPPGKAAADSHVQMKHSAKLKESHWWSSTSSSSFFPWGFVLIVTLCACVCCGSACSLKLQTVDLNFSSLWWSCSTLIPVILIIILPWMELEKLDSVSLYIYSAVIAG